MSTNHILLTGGTGFFGKALLRHWSAIESTGQAVGHVTLLSRDPKRFADQYPELVTHHWLQLIKGDVCDSASLPTGQTFTHVLHAATESTTGPLLPPMQRFDQIVNGTRNILELAVTSGASRFLLTSSGGVYGPQPPDMERIPETYLGMPEPLDHNNAYSVAKRTAEHLCALYREQYGIATVIARCFAFVGQDLPLEAHFAIGNFIRDALWRNEITVSGDGSPLRSYLDQQDLAQWLLKLMEYGESGQAYNVGSDQAISIAELAHVVRDILSPNKKVNIVNSINQIKGRNIYIPSIEKARNQFALKINILLKESIMRTADAAIK